MWFAVGTISLIGFVYFFVRWRSASRWKGTQGHIGKQAYEYHRRTHKNRTTGVLIGLPCDTALEFCLKRENFIDRVFKGLGLSEEQQINRLHFDEKVYVVSDDPRLGVLLKYHNDLPALLENLFEPQRFTLGSVRKLWCQRNRLWVECKPAKDFGASDVAALAQDIVPVLTTVRDALLAKPDTSGAGRDHFIARAVILLGISTALAVSGAVQGVRTLMLKFPVILEPGALWKTAFMVGGAMTAALIVGCILWLGRTSRAHLVLIELLLAGSVGSVLTAFAELRDYNIDFDQSEVRNERVQVTQHYTTRCGKRNRSTCYHVNLAPFAGKPDGLKLTLDQAMFERLRGHSHLTLPIHAGALGWRWVEAPQVADAKSAVSE